VYYSTDPANRAEFITALRNLADFLAANPAVPVPLNGDVIRLHASSYEDGGKAQVDQIARLLGRTVTDDTADGGHYVVTREFGPLMYVAVAIPDSRRARFDAESSYRGCVIPDRNPANPDGYGEHKDDSPPVAGCPEPGCGRTQPCEGCIDAEELSDRIASVRRTQEAWWL
jgi:hypothetical protein